MKTKNTDRGGKGSLKSMYGEKETTYSKATPRTASTLPHGHGWKVWGKMGRPLTFYNFSWCSPWWLVNSTEMSMELQYWYWGLATVGRVDLVTGTIKGGRSERAGNVTSLTSLPPNFDQVRSRKFQNSFCLVLVNIWECWYAPFIRGGSKRIINTLKTWVGLRSVLEWWGRARETENIERTAW